MIIDFATLAITFLLILLWIVYTKIFGAEWVRMPKEIRKKALSMLKLNKKDIFYDLGCGDGSLVFEAAPRVKKAIGIEIDPIRFLIAKARTSKHKNVKIIYGNLFKQSLNDATKLTVFLSPEAHQRLSPKLKQLERAVIAAYKWPIPKLKLLQHDIKERLFLYVVNLKWRKN